MTYKKILFIGCGKMGSAVLKNLISNGFDENNFMVLKPSKKNLIKKIKYISSYSDLPKNYQADLVVFGFKPQVAKEILNDFVKAKITNQNTIFVSILAGKKTEFFEKILGKSAKIVRLMPNLPTLINEGISGYYLNQNIKKSEEKSLTKFLNGISKNIKVTDENLINSVTAISGSGPAYLFLFIKSMIESAKDLGLDAKSSEILVEQTIFGASKIALLTNKDLEELISSVASKGGTTEAALKVLHKNNQFQKIISNAVKAAHKQSVKLSS